jgi:putative transposase
MITPNAGLPVSLQCSLLGITRSSFYYQPRPASADALDLLNRLDRIFTEHPVYGSRRLQATLLREGSSVGRRRVRRLIRKLGLSAIRPKRRTSRSHPEHKIYPYLLRHKTIDQPNLVWSADITSIPMRRGFLYLVAFIDRSTRRVLSWRLSNTLTVGFSVEALGEAIGEISRHFLPSTAIPRFQNSLAIHAAAAWPGPWQHADKTRIFISVFAYAARFRPSRWKTRC